MKNDTYITERNKLIPIASVYAYARAGKEPERTDKGYRAWAEKWNVYFHSQMKELAKSLWEA